MKHGAYTIFALRNTVSMLKNFKDPDCALYQVSLNLLGVLLSAGNITGDEYYRLCNVFGTIHSNTLFPNLQEA